MASVAAACALLPKPRPKTALRGSVADQGDITWTRACVLPSERPVAVEILPPVAFADIPCTGRVKYVVLSLVDCCKRNTKGALLGREHAASSIALDFRGIIAAFSTKPRRDEHIWPQGRITGKSDLDR